MPIYEYQCRQCQHRLEKLQRMSDAPLVTCPECGQDALKKLVSAAAFRLKGSGWYETDFKKDGKKNLAGDDAGTSGSGGDHASDGKPGDSASSNTESADNSSKTKPKSDASTAKAASTSGNG